MRLIRFLSTGVAVKVLLALCIMLACGNSLNGQSTAVAEGITGSVVDPSGAAIANATVVATNVGTGVESRTVTTGSGYFAFIGLVFGTYKVTATAPGFTTVEQDNITVVSGQRPNVAIKLAVGASSQTVTVIASVATMVADKTSTTTGDVVPVEEVASLPILVGGGTRSPLNYLYLFSGVSPNTYGSRGGGGLQWSEINGTGDGGGYGTVTGYKVDGIYLSGDQSQSLSANYPVPQAIQEVRLVTNTNADEGFDLGSVFELITKSGTNRLHGEAYEYVRNEALDSRNFFSANNPPERQHDFGILLGGPIKKDKLFFFVNYAGFREQFSSTTDVLSVPTALMHQGNFSQELGAQIGSDGLGRPVYQGEIFDPTTSRADGNGGTVRDPFITAGVMNVIPQNRWSKIGAFYLGQYPLPNNGAGVSGNYIAHEVPQTSHSDRTTTKIDYNINTKQRLTVAFDKPFRTANSTCSNLLGNDFQGFGPYINSCYLQTGSFWNTSERFSYSNSIASNLLFQFNAGITYSYGTLFLGPQPAKSDSTAGITGTWTDGVPQVNISNFQGFGTTQSTETNSGGTESAIAFLTWMKGSHQIQFGSNWVLPWNLSANAQYGAGVFSFDGGGTRQPDFLGGGPGQQPGLAISDFLLGWVDSGRVDAPFDQRSSSQQWAWYVQDQWRVTPKLSLTYGLRYELYVPPHEEHNRVADFCPTCPNAAAGGHLGALQFWGNVPGGNGLKRDFNIYPYAFSPRLGLAYAWRQNTIARFYAGIQRYPINIVQVNGFYFPNYGWGASLQPATTDGGITPAFQWDTSTFGTLPSLPQLNPTFLTAAPGHAPNGVPYWNPSDNKPANAIELGAQVQHEFPGGLVVSAKYASKLVHGLPTNNLDGLNQLPLKYLSLGQLLNQQVTSAQAVAAGIPIPYPGFTGTVLQALRPYPQYSTIENIQSMDKNTYWHAAVLSAQQRFHNGFTFLVNYTISKMLSNDPYYISGQLGNYFVGSVQSSELKNKTGRGFPWTFQSGIGGDRPQVLNISYTYELPFGRGKRFLGSADGAMDRAVGGWRVAGIQSYDSGTPIFVGASVGVATLSIWPNRVPGQPIRGPASCENYTPAPGNANPRYLNINAFANPPAFTLGTMEPDQPSVRTCGITNENLSLSKDVKINERFKFQIGVDAVNIFNRHTFYSLSSTTGIASSFGAFSNASDARSLQLHAHIFF